MNNELELLARAESHDPWRVLSWHPSGKEWLLRVFIPGAEVVSARDEAGSVHPLAPGAPGGLFERVFERRFPYVLEVRFPGGTVEVFEDPYAFRASLFGEMDLHLFNEGRHAAIGGKLGASPLTVGGTAGYAFAVWAPNAVRVSVVGDFNRWDGRRHQMRSLGASGIWEIFIPGLGEDARYKYEIRTRDGGLLLKADPCARRAEFRPRDASVTVRMSHRWGDARWLERRAEARQAAEPMAVYEVHLGSWRRRGDRFLTYRELAEELPAYLGEMGYSWVEFLPVTEHPLDASWGYQTTGFFAPTCRHGAADDLCVLVDALHAAGIGVIADWTPAHFPKDEFGLYRFDGTHLYEHADPRLRDHPDWGSAIFNYARNEVRSFLTSSACSWLRDFHFDGLRIDAVASMLYLDYSRPEGAWLPNVHGGRENLDAVAFLRDLNVAAHVAGPGTFTVAEESTAWPMVSRPVHEGGLGFSFKWNMGWMHDTLHYFGLDPVHRKHHQRDLTFGLLYAFSEHFVLPLSHDEVVHGKRSLLGRMPGDWWQQRANLRLLYLYQYCHPGKKLLFMGGEFAPGGEWDSARSLDWRLLDREEHRQIRRFVCDLNRVYHRQPALWERDADTGGFEWIDFRDADSSIVSFVRRSSRPEDFVLAVFNFTPVPRPGYRVGVPRPGIYRELINSDSSFYGGGDVGNAGSVASEPVPCHGRRHSLLLNLPPLAGLILSPGQ